MNGCEGSRPVRPPSHPRTCMRPQNTTKWPFKDSRLDGRCRCICEDAAREERGRQQQDTVSFLKSENPHERGLTCSRSWITFVQTFHVRVRVCVSGIDEKETKVLLPWERSRLKRRMTCDRG